MCHPRIHRGADRPPCAPRRAVANPQGRERGHAILAADARSDAGPVTPDPRACRGPGDRGDAGSGAPVVAFGDAAALSALLAELLDSAAAAFGARDRRPSAKGVARRRHRGAGAPPSAIVEPAMKRKSSMTAPARGRCPIAGWQGRSVGGPAGRRHPPDRPSAAGDHGVAVGVRSTMRTTDGPIRARSLRPAARWRASLSERSTR